jgi:hypothetical protein
MSASEIDCVTRLVRSPAAEGKVWQGKVNEVIECGRDAERSNSREEAEFDPFITRFATTCLCLIAVLTAGVMCVVFIEVFELLITNF